MNGNTDRSAALFENLRKSMAFVSQGFQGIERDKQGVMLLLELFRQMADTGEGGGKALERKLIKPVEKLADWNEQEKQQESEIIRKLETEHELLEAQKKARAEFLSLYDTSTFKKSGIGKYTKKDTLGGLTTLQTGQQAQLESLIDERSMAYMYGFTDNVAELTMEIERLQMAMSGGLLGDGAIEKTKEQVDAIDGATQAMRDSTLVIAGAFSAAAGESVEALYDLIVANEDAAQSIPELLMEMARQSVKAIAVESATQALYQAAMGLAKMAMVAMGFAPAGPSAGFHFAAAAQFAAVAGVATATGAVIGGPSGSSASAGGSYGTSGGASTSEPTGRGDTLHGYAVGVQRQQQPVIVNVVDRQSFVNLMGSNEGRRMITNVVSVDYDTNGQMRGLMRRGY